GLGWGPSALRAAIPAKPRDPTFCLLRLFGRLQLGVRDAEQPTLLVPVDRDTVAKAL
ncbi:MAG: hypothetical protein ACI8TX_003954, partial [Hyphomicrobiaceae bacterium]